MPLADKNYTFYQFPLPAGYRRLSRRKRVIIELAIGASVLILFAIAVSVQMPRWLQIAGWIWFLLSWVLWMVLVMPGWIRRRFRGR
jgi:hypothetical protein